MSQHLISGPFKEPQLRGIVVMKLGAASSSVLAFDHWELHVSKCSSKNDSVRCSFAYRDNSPLLEAHGVQELATLIKGRHIRL